MNKKGYAWAVFLTGLVLGLVLVYLLAKGMLPVNLNVCSSLCPVPN
jgi:hypothetical protein